MKILSSTVVYKCPIFVVEERQVQVADNEVQTHWVVLRQPNVGIVALTSDKKFVLVKERRGASDELMLELPSGKMYDFNPSFDKVKAQALAELEEEGGYSAKNIELIEKHSSGSNWYERDYYKFAAWDLEEVGQKLEPGEEIEVVLLSPVEVETLITKSDLAFEDDIRALRQGLEFFRMRGLL